MRIECGAVKWTLKRFQPPVLRITSSVHRSVSWLAMLSLRLNWLVTRSVSDMDRHFGFIAVARWRSGVPKQELAVAKYDVE